MRAVKGGVDLWMLRGPPHRCDARPGCDQAVSCLGFCVETTSRSLSVAYLPLVFLSKTDTMSFHQEHELRLSNLEDVLGKLTEKSEVCISTFPQQESTCLRAFAHTPQPARRSLLTVVPCSWELILLLSCFTSLPFSRTPRHLFKGGLSLFLLEVTQPSAE